MTASAPMKVLVYLDAPSAAEMVPRELLACTVFKGDFPFPCAGVFEG